MASSRRPSSAIVSQTDSLPLLSSFSPDANLFAFIVLAVDKHRLRVYNTASGRAASEHTIDSGRVSALTWATLPDSLNQERSSPNKKRKKSVESQASQIHSGQEVVALGLSNGNVLFFSPTHSKVIHTLSHPTSNSAITSLAFHKAARLSLWTSSADGSVRLWDIQKNTALGSWKGEDRIPPTAISVRPTSEDSIDLLVAHHSIRLLIVDATRDHWSGKPKQLATFTGHATSIQTLLWTHATQQRSFFSMASGDRFVYYWSTEGASSNEKPLASISLDSDVRAIALSPPSQSPQTLVTLSASGKLSFIPIPSEIPLPAGGKPSKILSFLPRSSISSLSKSRPSDPPVFDFIPLPDDPGTIRVVRLVNGIQPVFDFVRYLDDSGAFIDKPVLDEIPEDTSNEDPSIVSNKRYVESRSLAVGSGMDIDRNDNSAVEDDAEGALQVDLAELSLGQRLTAVTEGLVDPTSDSDDDNAVARTPGRSKSKKQDTSDITAIPTNSLARTLIQALHSSDSRLLEMCLAHSDSALILNTVRRLPPQLAIPLITACVERMGRGPRSANMKGGGGGASSQRGLGLLTWLRTALTVHIGHLMTIPDLVARLSGLHATLTARLSLHESLLSLSGRLDMVLNQVELRASTTPASLAPSKTDKRKPENHIKQYVEGETDSEEEADTKMDAGIEDADDDVGSIEDIELGADTENEDEEGDDDDDESLSGGDDGKFIDDEAEEYTGDEEDEEESE